MTISLPRRVVITGYGVVSPLGNTGEKLHAALRAGQSGIAELQSLPPESLPVRFGGECREFTGNIDDFGPLEKDAKRNIKKGTKVMCREIQMGVAAGELALGQAALAAGSYDPERIGCVYGCGYLTTLPDEFTDAVRTCTDAEGKFHFSQWGDRGLAKVDPLWLLKFLPNMPASHVAIYNDLRGPNNSLTLREASSNAALAEAYLTIVRGHAETMIAGATGSRIHPLKSVQSCLEEEIATGDDPTKLARPFDRNRKGSVLGEGAAALVLENRETARNRGATVYGEVVGYGSSTVVDRRGVANIELAVENALRQSLRTSGLGTAEIGHVHAHGLGTQQSDRAEAQAIARVFGGTASTVPVVAAKSYFGNLGAAGGMVELLGSLLAMQEGQLFSVLNFETPDPGCPVNVVRSNSEPAGDSFINVNVTSHAQATALVVKRFHE